MSESKVLTKSADNPLVGSCHKYSDGYGMILMQRNFCDKAVIYNLFSQTAGYGQRYLTSRNLLTLPCSVPIIRHPPPTERYLRVTSSTQLIGSDGRAERRNADQIKMQTSGEVGRFYIDAESQGVKLGKTLLQRPANNYATESNKFTADQSEFKSRPATDRTTSTGRYEDEGYFSGRNSQSSARGPLDSSGGNNVNASSAFGTATSATYLNASRRDLFAASAPSRSQQELVWCVANNSRGARQSQPWAERLRKESTSGGSTGGGGLSSLNM